MKSKPNKSEKIKKAAKKKGEKADDSSFASSRSGSDDFSVELIKELNKEAGERIAFNLGSDEDAPTNIKRWISSGSRQLDCILSNKVKGGFPEGRIVELSGGTSVGKSHVCYEVCKSTQRLGGIVVYIDTENATSLETLEQLGINVNERFVFVQTVCTEEIFAVAESSIKKARSMTKNVPVTIIWDSIAASSPKAELEGDYDQNSIGLQARSLGKGIRKISQIIGNQNVLFFLVNQLRTNIGVMFGDDKTTPGGMAIPYACSQRIRITSTGQKQIKDKEGNVIGVVVSAKTIKNKVARPFRAVNFTIIFGVGIVEHEEVFDSFREHCAKEKDGVLMPNGERVSVDGVGAWKTFIIYDADGVVKTEIKFHKPEFGEKVLYRPEFSEYMEALYEATFVQTNSVQSILENVNSDSLQEIQALKMMAEGN